MYFNEKRQGLAPFVNLRSDVGFKAVFADRNNKDILIGVLNQILATLGPAAATALAGGALGRLLEPGQAQISPEQAAQITPEQVSVIAAQAEQSHPGVVDRVSQFYGQHAGLIKLLGGAAVAVALAKMKEHASH